MLDGLRDTSRFLAAPRRVLGAILGDVVGSVYEGRGLKRDDFPLFGPGSCFTDDTVLNVATADALLSGRPYRECYREYGRHGLAGRGLRHAGCHRRRAGRGLPRRRA